MSEDKNMVSRRSVLKGAAAGGVGIKYQADEDSLDVVVQGLKRAMKIIAGEEHLEPQKLTSLDRSVSIGSAADLTAMHNEIEENFHDGRNPQDKGDSRRHGIPKHASLSSLDRIVHSKSASPRKKQLAHWQANMRRGRNK